MIYDWQDRPLSFIEVLDLTFRILKDNFTRLFLIALIFMGPIYVIEGIGNLTSGIPLVGPGGSAGITSLLSGVSASANLSAGWPQVMLFSVSTLLLFFFSMPMSYASIMLATEQVKNQAGINITSTLKRSFSRYFPLLGSILLYGLIGYGLLTLAIIVVATYVASTGLFSSLTGIATGLTAGPPANLGLHIVVIIILSLITLCAFTYLMTRWSFFFPAIVFEKVAPGLGKSWRLTRGHFWRLVGLYLVVIIIDLLISFVFQALVMWVLGNSLLAFILSSLVSLVVSLVPVIAYAVIYFDFGVRNEAIDLKNMLKTYGVKADTASPEAIDPQSQSHADETKVN